MKKNIIYLMFILICVHVANAQKEEKVNPKYLATLVYLKTNKEIQQKIKKFNNHWLKRDKVKKNECLDFNLSKYIQYMEVPDFTHESNDLKFRESDSLMVNKKAHREKYSFDLLEVPEFKELVPDTESKLYLLFSKPIDNYLIAEFMIKSSNHEIDMAILKKGPALHLLIFFDEKGLVKEVYTAGSYYN